MWAKVKRRCAVMLRFTWNFRGGRGERWGILRGEQHGDNVGELVRSEGLEWIFGDSLSWKEASLCELSQEASLKKKKSSCVDSLAVQFVHLTATAFSQRRIVTTLQPVFWAHWWELGIWTCPKQRLWMDTDMKAGDHSPHRSLCLHSTVSELNMARAWRTVPLWFVASSGEPSACGSAFLVVVKLWLPSALVWTSSVIQHVAAPTLPSSRRTRVTREECWKCCLDF